jgi:hypothetical protein
MMPSGNHAKADFRLLPIYIPARLRLQQLGSRTPLVTFPIDWLMTSLF